MTLILELEKPEHWIIRDSQTLTAVDAPLSEYLSIATFSSNIIGVMVESEGALETWDFAGWMNQKINLPFGSNTSPSTLNYRKLFLRRKQLFIFPEIFLSYQLSARFPRWFSQASIKIWEYQGPKVDTIESKLDTLLQQHPL